MSLTAGKLCGGAPEPAPRAACTWARPEKSAVTRLTSGNVTGFSILATDLSGKRLELLKEVVATLSSVGVILNPANPQPKIELKEVEAAARTLGLQIHPIQISAESSLQSSFESIARDRSVQAVIVLTDALLYNHRKQIATLAAANRIPAMYFFPEFVADGGLMSYGPSDTDFVPPSGELRR
jgi:putative tryptophan/tyrosine transport system substrate-binding protein